MPLCSGITLGGLGACLGSTWDSGSTISSSYQFLSQVPSLPCHHSGPILNTCLNPCQFALSWSGEGVSLHFKKAPQMHLSGYETSTLEQE